VHNSQPKPNLKHRGNR